MINAFFEVVKDLWFFAFGVTLVEKPIPLTLKAGDVVNDAVTKTEVKSETKADSRIGTPKSNSPSYAPSVAAGRLAYVVKDSVACVQQPSHIFDTVVGFLSYGDEVMVGDMGERLVHVDTPKFSGWVETEALSDDRKKVFPNLVPGFSYNASSEEAFRLRRYIKDELLGHELRLPLQSIEFIIYTLKRSNVTIAWPNERPRTPGTWKTILRGVAGVSMSIEPHTGAVFEYAGNGTPGFLGYVLEVRPDKSIKMASVGRIKEGEYLVEEFTSDEWKEWRPVYISFA
ncbi:hypothetical protein H6784_00205 [Candidatus Nomurabacteria bacterium]|nr:hypothetical protein [Candidatus Kaiserbacteria bacterium]MCB9813815.1 hypothetical protein [Candidatus Nomurabacteria bacterium]